MTLCGTLDFGVLQVEVSPKIRACFTLSRAFLPHQNSKELELTSEMSETVTPEKPQTREIALTVPEDEIQVLWPKDDFQALGSPGWLVGCCFVLAGTSPRSAIIMANMSCPTLDIHQARGMMTAERTLDIELRLMTLVRRAVGIFIEHQEQFQHPRTWLMIDRHKCPGWADIVQYRIQHALRHLGLETEVLNRATQAQEPLTLAPFRRAVVVLKNDMRPPDVYLGGSLVYPRHLS